MEAGCGYSLSEKRSDLQKLCEDEDGVGGGHHRWWCYKPFYRCPPPPYELHNHARPEHIYIDLSCGPVELQSVRNEDLHELSFHRISPCGDHFRQGSDSRNMSEGIQAPNDNGVTMDSTKQFGRMK